MLTHLLLMFASQACVSKTLADCKYIILNLSCRDLVISLTIIKIIIISQIYSFFTLLIHCRKYLQYRYFFNDYFIVDTLIKYLQYIDKNIFIIFITSIKYVNHWYFDKKIEIIDILIKIFSILISPLLIIL